MRELLWRALAFIVTRPAVSGWIIERAKRTPYRHLPGYMSRYWLFNPYSTDVETERTMRRWRWLPSIRVHHILRHDLAAHPHDHPWDARTVVLRGWYVESRVAKPSRVMWPGDTSAIRFDHFHHISAVSEGGVYTLFFTWDYCGTWGFLVDGVKVPHKQCLAEHPERAA